jgi:hypothetical protein
MMMKTSTDIKDFKIRSYGMTELALLYSPELTGHGALKKLKRWISMHPDLEAYLRVPEGRNRARSFMPVEVKAIVERLGEP